METPILLALIITALPLAAFAVQVFVGRFLPRQGDWLPTTAIAGGLCLSLYLMVTQVLGAPEGMESVQWSFTWLDIGTTSGFAIDFEVFLDNMSVIMLFVVTLVSFLVHLFSMGYMHGEERYNRFYAYLALFSFSMLGLIITSNLLFLFIFWELVGVCSYFLIGFYFEKDSAAAACKKAFLTNRIGDTGFFVGIMMIYSVVGSFSFPDIYESVRHVGEAGGWDQGVLAAAGILIFLGAVSKSAQFPLHVWLPDAMEGPTPVSALIHAATMVAAGVYMICRMFPFLAGWDADAGMAAMESGNYFDSTALTVIAYVGGFTAIFAATIAVAQNDIKGVLAYSTVSQLGYMVMAVGLGSVSAAMFHLFTHAMFKACLFLGSGSVIHAMHHEQDIRKMGGLRHKLPVTFATFMIATLALCGLPLFSGAISKEAVLTQGLAFWNYHGGIISGLPFLMASAAAGLTSFYMMRLCIKTFFGKPADEHAYDHAHESPKTMTIPLMSLALMSLFGAGLAIPFVGPGIHWFENRTSDEVIVGGMMTNEAIVEDASVRDAWASQGQYHDLHAHHAADNAPIAVEEFHHAYHAAHYPTFFVAIGLGLFGILLAYWIFHRNREKKYIREGSFLARYQVVLENLYFVDKFYAAGPIRLLHWIARVFLRTDKLIVDGIVNAVGVVSQAVAWVAGLVDKYGVDGSVRGIGALTLSAGRRARRLQTGRIQDYVGLTVFCLGIVFLVVMSWDSMFG